MKIAKIVLFSAFTISVSPAVQAQVSPDNQLLPAPSAARPVAKLSDLLAQNLEKSKQTEITRERREQSYAKLLEAQRYYWNASPARMQNRNTSGAALAKQALQKAVELNPFLAEAYTALAELAITMPPSDVDEAITLASLATRLDRNNFGAHRIMARLYTFKSRNRTGNIDTNYLQKAIGEWKEVARLDSRNAEAWAFLSELYDKTNNQEERIESLKKWVAAATPIDTQFYRNWMGGQENLSPENASMKLGNALLKAGKTREALEIITQMVIDEPENNEAIEMLREAVEYGDKEGAALAAESLQQAVFANPDNPALIVLLAETQARAGRFDEANKVLQTASAKLAESDKVSAANLQVALGDLMSKAKRTDEAIAAYQKSLVLRGVKNNTAVAEDERDFVISVFEKMIQTYKNANRPNDVKLVIERARQVLGKNDLFADRQTISFYRESGMKQEALQAVRALRARQPNDYGVLRLEATILTENGKVDEAVALVKSLIKKKQ
ncbi:MAG TPA: tetratricopeptide repeat protein [Pyrinomonadaceae bacterium]|jgi:tetratricopeptide (TPR) repeat protein